MAKQRPDPERMANELAGASAFFKRPAPAAPRPEPAADAPAAVAPAPASPAPTAPPAEAAPVRPGRPGRRVMIRHAFELYADQLEALRELADAQRRRGEPGSMSKMVRDAIDRLLDEAAPGDD